MRNIAVGLSEANFISTQVLWPGFLWRWVAKLFFSDVEVWQGLPFRQIVSNGSSYFCIEKGWLAIENGQYTKPQDMAGWLFKLTTSPEKSLTWQRKQEYRGAWLIVHTIKEFYQEIQRGNSQVLLEISMDCLEEVGGNEPALELKLTEMYRRVRRPFLVFDAWHAYECQEQGLNSKEFVSKIAPWVLIIHAQTPRDDQGRAYHQLLRGESCYMIEGLEWLLQNGCPAQAVIIEVDLGGPLGRLQFFNPWAVIAANRKVLNAVRKAITHMKI